MAKNLAICVGGPKHGEFIDQRRYPSGPFTVSMPRYHGKDFYDKRNAALYSMEFPAMTEQYYFERLAFPGGRSVSFLRHESLTLETATRVMGELMAHHWDRTAHEGARVTAV